MWCGGACLFPSPLIAGPGLALFPSFKRRRLFCLLSGPSGEPLCAYSTSTSTVRTRTGIGYIGVRGKNFSVGFRFLFFFPSITRQAAAAAAGITASQYTHGLGQLFYMHCREVQSAFIWQGEWGGNAEGGDLLLPAWGKRSLSAVFAMLGLSAHSTHTHTCIYKQEKKHGLCVYTLRHGRVFPRHFGLLPRYM